MNDRRHVISGAFVFLLLGLFALLSTVLVLIGARSYNGMVDRSAVHNDQRVVDAFVRNAVRAAEEKDCVYVEDEDGVCAVELYSGEMGEEYVRYIYYYDGALCDLYTSAMNAFDPEDGEHVCDLHGMEAEIENGLLTLRLTDAMDRQHIIQIALVCEA